MEISNNYLNIVHKINEIIEKEPLSDVEKLNFQRAVHEVFAVKSTSWLKIAFGIAVIILFISSYAFFAFVLNTVFSSELVLIKSKLMLSSERSINATTISVLAAATAVQTGLAFSIIIKYLFPIKSIPTPKTP